MNARIDNLSTQAHLWALEKAAETHLIDSACYDDAVGNLHLEKFAELIVRECAEVCRRQQYYDADDEYKRGVNGGSFTCMNAIKREFGVE